MKRLQFAGLIFSIFLIRSLSAGNPVFESGPKKVQLLELFTSEGCSSCPPAEASLGKLADDPRLWREFIPVAFHVDYWDHLGWKDPFASVEWTRRQRTYAASWNSETVYTPEFVLNGREWRGATVPAAGGEVVGVLKIELRSEDTVSVTFESGKSASGNFDVYVARLGFGMNMNVRGGENSGRNLRHDFVVTSLAHEKLGRGAQEIQLPVDKPNPSAKRTSLVAWVTLAGEIAPVQAAGGWLPSMQPSR
ncbi:MAG: DUF1223 domain-containing protein [Chthoniobacterales bacterium]